MNVEQALQWIQNFRSQLEAWGVTNGTLMLVAAVAGIVFFFSFREVACWYFRISRLRDEVQSLRMQIETLQQTLDKSGTLSAEEDASAESQQNAATPNKFRFDH